MGIQRVGRCGDNSEIGSSGYTDNGVPEGVYGDNRQQMKRKQRLYR